MENKATVYVLGAAAVIVSSVKLDDWRMADLFGPDEATAIENEDGDTVFTVACGTGTGTVNDSGITWGSYTTEDGYATVTVLLDEGIGNNMKAVMDFLEIPVSCLIQIERKYSKYLEETGRYNEHVRLIRI